MADRDRFASCTSPAPRGAAFYYWRPFRLGRWVAGAVLMAFPLAFPWAVAAGPDAGAPDVAGAGQMHEGRLTANALVYSTPGQQSYPTMRLKEGSTVLVAGIKNDWLKIVPPEGSFSYVPRAFVNVHGDGQTGRGLVNKPVVAKAGSSMQPMKYAPQAKLEAGDTVNVIGEDAEYYKIAPPQGAFLYINKDFVAYVPPAIPQGPTAHGGAGGGTGAPAPPDTGPSFTTTPGPRDVAAGPLTSSPASATTQPGVAALLTQLQKAEADFAEVSTKPLAEQPVGDLLAEYEALAGNPALPEMARRIVDVRTTTLKIRSEARDQFQAAQKQQQDFQDRIKAQKAEKDEIEQKIKEIDIQLYAAVGTLRSSSLQVGRVPLYRLTDPQTGRTVVYVWATDPKIPDLVGQFVGVKGPMQTDARLNLKVVTPTACEAVDPGKVNGSVAAEIVPASFLSKGATAAAAGQ